MSTLTAQSVAEIILPSNDLPKDIGFYKGIGFRLDNIFPSDDPQVAIISGHGIRIRLDKQYSGSSSTINILTDEPNSIGNGDRLYTSPSGTKIELHPLTYKLETPTTEHTFEVRRLVDNDPWVIGRAGMQYRDLIPNRLGGSIIASHIRIPDGGPVPDMVHYHTIGFQLIFCYKGWVKLVYEDQGEPFILKAGDCVNQPPEIRHRVLEASDNLQVIEIGVPAEHMTTIDHELELPSSTYNPDREFDGQKFCRHQVANATWKPWRINGFDFRETGMTNATKGVASVQVAKSNGKKATPITTSHDSDILFTFVLQGSINISSKEYTNKELNDGDAFTIPPGQQYELSNWSDDIELLEVALPGHFETFEH